jgi:mRNA interferase MazF
MRRGELYRVKKPGGDGRGSRVFVVVSRQALIDSRFASVVCAPIYSRGEGLSTQVPIGPDQGLKHDSWIMCDNLVSVQKGQLTDYIGSLTESLVSQLNRGLRSALDLL